MITHKSMFVDIVVMTDSIVALNSVLYITFSQSFLVSFKILFKLLLALGNYINHLTYNLKNNI